MDHGDYENWWPLHLKASRGEDLSAEEYARYQDGLARLRRSEHLNPAVDEVRAAKRIVTQLHQQQATLRARREELEAEITAVEQALNEHARQLLDAKD